VKSDLYVQYGCGLCAPPTWRNFDSSPTLRLQRTAIIGDVLKRTLRLPAWPSNVEYGDIVLGLPIPLGSCKGIYCSHVLEHLALEDLRRALVNTYNYLSHEGTFRLVMPDLRLLAERYVAQRDENAAFLLMQASGLGRRERVRGLKGVLKFLLSNSGHLWLWDYESIRSELARIGFRNIRRAEFGDAADERFRDVEDEARWHECLAVECVKYG